jgi:hypothetical protein
MFIREDCSDLSLIFLDIDGVLNCDYGFDTKQCPLKNIEDTKTFYSSFYPDSKKWINKLIEKTNSKIVISSMWRSYGEENLKKIWIQEGMAGEIVGLTPSISKTCITTGRKGLDIPRGFEISNYLFDKYRFTHCYTNTIFLKSYIIIDDDIDMLYEQKDRFIHVNSSKTDKGFGYSHYLKSLNMMKKPLVKTMRNRCYL